MYVFRVLKPHWIPCPYRQWVDAHDANFTYTHGIMGDCTFIMMQICMKRATDAIDFKFKFQDAIFTEEEVAMTDRALPTDDVNLLLRTRGKLNMLERLKHAIHDEMFK